jgi:hypothetical protein
MGEIRNGYKSFVENAEGKRQVGRPRLRREDNIKIDLREIGLEDMDCIHAT